MNKKRWKLIDSIVDEALDLQGNQREAFLERRCRLDPSLRKEVFDLLDSIDNSEGFWNQLLASHEAIVNDYSKTLISENSETYKSSLESTIGPYKLNKRIGLGGMGEVWLAKRIDGHFSQQVAIKLMRPETGLEIHYRRFHQERQILASMNHPNVARLLDGGLTLDGRPYLVMEYVEGIPITEYCYKHECSLIQRLDLFGKVCQAVQYAHRNLVVHRDLKPDNILVTEEGTVKVLDFGIAKLLDADLTDRTLIETRPGLRMMSLNYAAPEQVSIEPITTATDIYALGLLLYELLTEFPPFDMKGKKLIEAEHIIREEVPPKPSQKSTRWQSELKGDLDSIILKSLRKEPEQRYESVGQFLEDINRSNRNLPVLARSDTLHYRTVKFLKRHRAGLAASAVVLVLSLGFGLFHTAQITQERNAAQLQAEKAQQVTDFLIDVFEYSNPTTENPEDITAREILEEGSDYLQNTMDGQPEIQATLMSAMGRIYTNLGMYDRAKPMLLEALDINRQYPSESNLALTFHNLGDLYTNIGVYDSAEIYLQEAVDHYQQSQNNASFAGSMESLGWLHYTMGNYGEADSLFLAALPLQQKVHGEKSPEAAQNMQLRAWVQHDLGKYDMADSLFRQVLELRRSLLGNEHKDVATTLHSLGWVLYQKKDFVQADSVMRKALAIRESLYPEGHMDVAWSMNNMGLIQQALGRYEETEKLFNASLEMRKTILGEGHPHVAQSLGNLASFYYNQSAYEQAVSIFEEVIEIDRKRMKEDHPQLGIDYNNLATTLNKLGKKREALEYYGKALNIVKQSLPASHPSVVRLSDNMADVHLDLEEYDKAEQLYLTCFQALKQDSGLEHRFTQVIVKRLAELYERTNQPAKATYYRSLLIEEEKQ